MRLEFLINTWKSSHFSTVPIKDPFLAASFVLLLYVTMYTYQIIVNEWK